MKTVAITIFLALFISSLGSAADRARPRPRERERERERQQKERIERESAARERASLERAELEQRLTDITWGREMLGLLHEQPSLKGEARRIAQYLEILHERGESLSHHERQRLLGELAPNPVALQHLRGTLREAVECIEMRRDSTWERVTWNNLSTEVNRRGTGEQLGARIHDLVAVRRSDRKEVRFEVKASDVRLYAREAEMLRAGTRVDTLTEYVASGRSSRVFNELVRDFRLAEQGNEIVWRVTSIDPVVDGYARQQRLPLTVERYH